MNRFEGRVAIVTGASRGIGLAIARRLVDEGARVGITARNEEALGAAAATLGGDAKVLAVAGKAHDPAHRADAIAQVVDRFGRIDVLVNNAGTNPVMGPLLQLDQPAAAKVLEINVLAALGWTRAAAQAGLGSQDGAAVVNVASVAGVGISPGIGMYGASKAALINLTQQLAVELAPDIRVNAVSPAIVRTAFARPLYEGDEVAAVSSYPLKRLGEPDDVAAAVAFLASADASWVTGHNLILDGGTTLAGL